ncbi:MAG: TonB family protein [Pseudomonadota bacterium]|nr:TonB family protein [Pseudomonadota bacterium]
MEATELLQALLEATVVTSAAIVLVLSLRKQLRNVFGTRAAYGAWALVPASLLAILLPAREVATASGRLVAIPPPMPAMAELPATQMPGPQWMLVACWAAGLLGCALWLAARQLRFRRSLGRLHLRVDGFCEAECDVRGLPATLGLRRPRVIVPPGFDRRYDSAWRELMLAHESAHVSRGDIHANAVATVFRCLFWFNPLMHVATSTFRHDQELACDATVLAAHPQARRCYGEALLQAQLDSQALPLGCHFGFGHPLRERIAMLREQLPSAPRRLLGTVLVSVLVLGLATAAWAAQPPQEKDAPAARIEIGGESLPPPPYPEYALDHNLGGLVIMKVHVAADGSVEKAVIERSQPKGVFDDAALATVKRWKFTPAMENGKRVAGAVRVPIAFEIRSKEGDDVAPIKIRAEDPGPAAYDWIQLRLSAPIFARADCDVVKGNIASDLMWCGTLRK